MSTNLKITSHELVNEGYLRLDVVAGNQPCGTIDFIGEKINFNILGRSFFKGMEVIKNVELVYREGRLVFTFWNGKSLAFDCSLEEFEAVKAHTKFYE